MRSASPFRVRLRSPAQGWVCRIRGVFPSLRERFGRWHLYRARGSKPTYSTKPTLRAGCRDLQVPASDARHPTQAKGVLPGRIAMRGRERSISPPSDQKTRFAGFAVRTWLCGPAGRKPSHCGSVRDGGNAEGANLGACPVCRFAPRPHENRQGRKLNADAGLQPIRWLGCRNRPTSLCAPSDASDTGCRKFP